MPFCTSLPGHNPRYWDLVESIEVEGRSHELLSRRVKNNVEHHGVLYTPVNELQQFGDINALMSKHNKALYYKHTHRQLVRDKEHIRSEERRVGKGGRCEGAPHSGRSERA